MNKIVHGTIRGKTIELREDPGVADGQEVEVQVKAVEPQPWGEGIRRSAGALQNEPEWDQIMEAIYQERKLDRHPPAELE